MYRSGFKLLAVALIVLAAGTGCYSTDFSPNPGVTISPESPTSSQPAATSSSIPLYTPTSARPTPYVAPPVTTSNPPPATPVQQVPISASYDPDPNLRVGVCTNGLVTVYADTPDLTVNGLTIRIAQVGPSRYYLSFNDNGIKPFYFGNAVVLQSSAGGNLPGYVLTNVDSSNVRGIQSFEILTQPLSGSADYRIGAINLCT